MSTSAFHLEFREKVNLGSFYTSEEYVDLVWEFIEPLVDGNTVVLDPACGYGAFLRRQTLAQKVGNDIDTEALEIAKSKIRDAEFLNLNALEHLDRRAYGVRKDQKLIVIGNPPYNDTTSQAKKKLKSVNFRVDRRLKARDIGISFLKLFYYLRADYVCVLHPLSFLIKRANFNLLKGFKESYRLRESLIISSRVFHGTSRTSEFPIIIALYERNIRGMTYEYVRNYLFKTVEGKSFKLSDFDYVSNYVRKYPAKEERFGEVDVLFYTLRDINALRRNRTFLEKPTRNALKVDPSKLDFYLYIDVFKDFCEYVPYYLNNLDVIIDLELFNRFKPFFVSYALRKHSFLRKFYSQEILTEDREKLKEYFKALLGEHFCENS